jgi:hypothetical protein
MLRLRFPLGPVGGVLALALGVVSVAAERHHGGSGPGLASAILAGVAGGLALFRGDRLVALVAADALLAGAVTLNLLGLGAAFVVPLLPMLVATADASAGRPEPRHLARSTAAVGFAAGPARQTAAVVRKARDAAARRLLRAERNEPEPLRRSA